jgi:hypothetical protein
VSMLVVPDPSEVGVILHDPGNVSRTNREKTLRIRRPDGVLGRESRLLGQSYGWPNHISTSTSTLQLTRLFSRKREGSTLLKLAAVGPSQFYLSQGSCRKCARPSHANCDPFTITQNLASRQPLVCGSSWTAFERNAQTLRDEIGNCTPNFGFGLQTSSMGREPI